MAGTVLRAASRERAQFQGRQQGGLCHQIGNPLIEILYRLQDILDVPVIAVDLGQLTGVILELTIKAK
ncbi:hypothetical protein NS383_09315 [Pseudomonas oryzihabitans]|nr:hypothetical protein NS383_09315 [Pseudomonas psychrotolerans]